MHHSLVKQTFSSRWYGTRLKECESEKEWDSERESEKVWGWVLSIEMKTKVVQHVKSDWMRDWMSVRVRKIEIVRESESEKVCGWVLSIDMKTKVVQHVESEWMREWKSERVWESDLVPSFCLTFRHFLNKNKSYLDTSSVTLSGQVRVSSTGCFKKTPLQVWEPKSAKGFPSYWLRKL